MRVANFNIRATPPMRSRKVAGDLERARRTQAGIITWQELFRWPRYRRLLARQFRTHSGWLHFHGRARRSGITVDCALFTVQRVRSHQLSKGSLLARQPAREALEVVVAGNVFDQYATAVLSAHLTNGAYNGQHKHRSAKMVARRRRLWTQQWAELTMLVAKLHAEGLDVVLCGDFNRDDLPVLHAAAEVVLERGIVKMIVVPAQGKRIRAIGREVIADRALNTDHPALVATLRRV